MLLTRMIPLNQSLRYATLISCFFLSGSVSEDLSANKHIQHIQQLFRENVLPSLGGKIPESAFNPERIALNRLNQHGLFSPDGVYLQQREVHNVHQRFPLPKTLKIKPAFGHVRALSHRMVDTTYVIRDPVIINLIPTENAVSPTFPVSSLKLLSFFKRAHHHSKLKHHLSTPEENVFNELVPYLKKLHEYD